MAPANKLVSQKTLPSVEVDTKKTSNSRTKALPTIEPESPLLSAAGPKDPLGLTMTGKLPEIAEAFRTTGTVCVERTLRILNKTRPNKFFEQDADKLVERVKSMGRTFNRSKG